MLSRLRRRRRLLPERLLSKVTPVDNREPQCRQNFRIQVDFTLLLFIYAWVCAEFTRNTCFNRGNCFNCDYSCYLFIALCRRCTTSIALRMFTSYSIVRKSWSHDIASSAVTDQCQLQFFEKRATGVDQYGLSLRSTRNQRTLLTERVRTGALTVLGQRGLLVGAGRLECLSATIHWRD